MKVIEKIGLKMLILVLIILKEVDRFARFYIVCEAVPLGAPESPLIVCGLSDTLRRVSKRGRDTEWDANHGMEEIREFCFKEFAAVCLFWNFFVL